MIHNRFTLIAAGMLCAAASFAGPFSITPKGSLKIDGIRFSVNGFQAKSWKSFSQETTLFQVEQRSGTLDDFLLTGTFRIPGLPEAKLRETIRRNVDTVRLYRAEFEFTTSTELAQLGLGCTLPLDSFRGRGLVVDDRKITPSTEFDPQKKILFHAPLKESVVIPTPNGTVTLRGKFRLLVQDDRTFKRNTCTLRLLFTPSRGKITRAVLECAIVPAADETIRPVSGNGTEQLQFTAPRWKKADMPEFGIQPGSALDLSRRPRFSPERDGAMQLASDGAVTFRTQNGRTVRLIGFNVFPRLFLMQGKNRYEIHRTIDRCLAEAQRMGYDYIRLLSLFDRDPFQGASADFEFNLEFLDRLDYLIASARKYGLYLYGTTASYQLGRNSWNPVFRQSRAIKCETFFGKPERREEWRKLIVKLLTRVNPYTGIACKDDPAFLCFEFFNELEIFLRDLQRVPKSYPAETLDFVNTRYRAFLKKKYGSTENLAAAWGIPISAFSDVTFLSGRESRDAAAADWETFCLENAAGCLEFFRQVMREIDCERLVTQYNFLPSINFSRLRAEQVPITSINTYFGHPSNMMKTGSLVRQDSSLSATGSEFFKKAASVKLAGIPLFVSEYNHCFWNQRDYEGGLFFPAYSAFQGFSGITIHSEPVSTADKQIPLNNFRIANNPTKRANEFLSMALFRRGDVEQARYRAELVFPAEFFLTSIAGSGAVNTDQSALAFVTGFSLRFPGSAAQRNRRPDLTLTPDATAGIQSGDWSATIENSAAGKLTDAIAKLRAKQLLSPGNPTDPKKKRFVADTEELDLDLAAERLKIITPKTEAVTLRPGDSALRLKLMTIHSINAGCAAALTSLDDLPLAESRHMMFVLNTTSVSDGMLLSADRRKLIAPGNFATPRMETARVSVSLKLPDGNYLLYPLSLSGKRRAPLPVERRSGTVHFQLDTAQLPDGTTPFFELIRQ